MSSKEAHIPSVVLDTNLFVAAFWNKRSASAEILNACLEGQAHLYYTKQIMAEIRLILRDIRATAGYRRFVDEILKKGTEVKPLGLVSVVADDPEDDKFLDCALAANVEYVVTNDEHLLRLKTFDGVSIVKPSEFKQLLQADKRSMK